MLYRLHLLFEASPKAISGRTSYLQARLEFHRYPRLILKLFNAHKFGPPRNFTCASPWTWVDRSGFGSTYSNSFALLRLAFAPAPRFPLNLATARNSLVHSSIGTPSLSLRLFVDIRFQVLFHSPPGVLFTFPSWYYALSVASECLALEGGPPCFPQDSSCLVVLWIPANGSAFRVRGFHPVSPTFPGSSAKLPRILPVLNPAQTNLHGLGSALFARRYCGHLV